MSEVIVRMEMPKKNRFCELQCADLYCVKTSKKSNVFDTGERPSWCPIVRKLPEHHGDLIDRQDTIKEFEPYAEYESNRSNAEWVQRIKTVLNSMIAIIAATERNEDVNL